MNRVAIAVVAVAASLVSLAACSGGGDPGQKVVDRMLAAIEECQARFPDDPTSAAYNTQYHNCVAYEVNGSTVNG